MKVAWRFLSVVFEPESRLKEIGEGAFRGSGVKSIRIPSGIEKIQRTCFINCEYYQ
jgi:hypothetical protein